MTTARPIRGLVTTALVLVLTGIVVAAQSGSLASRHGVSLFSDARVGSPTPVAAVAPPRLAAPAEPAVRPPTLPGGLVSAAANSHPTAGFYAEAPAGEATSGNWSGYAVGGGPYTSVTGTFDVPGLNATPTRSYVYEWVGIDGVGGVGSLIQAGVAEVFDPVTDRVSAQAWWQIVPQYPLNQAIQGVAVAPGDSITVTISQVSGALWQIDLTNNTTGGTFSVQHHYDGPATSAEWIVEAPTSPSGAQLQLAEYHPAVTFSRLHAGGAQTTQIAWTMVQGGVTVSAPSAMTPAGFQVAYVAPLTPKLTPTQVNRITLGEQFTLTASSGAPYAQVQWQTSSNLVAWSVLTTVTLDASGNAIYTFTPTQTAYYRAYFNDTGKFSPAVIEVIVSQPAPTPTPTPTPTPAPGQTPNPYATGSITGTVYQPNGTPAAGLKVTAFEFPKHGGGSATTAPDGTYAIKGLGAGTYYLIVSDETGALPTGYVNGSGLTPFGPLASVVSVGTASAQVTVHVPSGHTISGVVTSDGHPLADITPYVCPALDGTLPYSGLVYCGNAKTSTDGTYSVAVLPGSYTVAFQDHDMYPWTFYSAAGATLDGAAATVLDATAVDVTGINVALSPPPDYGSIAGTVTTSSGAMRAGFSLSACSSTAPADCFSATTDSTGRYKIRVPDGSYTIALYDPVHAYPSGFYDAHASSGFSATLADATPVTVAGNVVSGIDVGLPVGHLVEGVVTGPDGSPLSGIVVTPCASPACSGQAAPTAADGSYTLNLAPGSYVLHFTEWSGAYLSGYYASHGLAGVIGATQVTVGSTDVSGIDVALHGISLGVSPGVTRSGPFGPGPAVPDRHGGYVTVRIAVGKGFAGALVDIQIATWSPSRGWSAYRSLTLRRVGADGYAYYFVRPTTLMSIRAGVRDPVVSAMQTAGGLGDVEVFSGSVVAEPR